MMPIIEVKCDLNPTLNLFCLIDKISTLYSLWLQDLPLPKHFFCLDRPWICLTVNGQTPRALARMTCLRVPHQAQIL